MLCRTWSDCVFCRGLVSRMLAESHFCKPASKFYCFFLPHAENLKLARVRRSQMLFIPVRKQVVLPKKHTVLSPRSWGLGLLFSWHTCYQTRSSLHLVLEKKKKLSRPLFLCFRCARPPRNRFFLRNEVEGAFHIEAPI